MKVYSTRRIHDVGVRCEVERTLEDGRLSIYPLPHVAMHSPTGFEMGYGGSGPADLALSLLADALGASRDAAKYQSPSGLEMLAWSLHQRFKAQVIADLRWRKQSFTTSDEDILRWIADPSHQAARPLP